MGVLSLFCHVPQVCLGKLVQFDLGVHPLLKADAGAAMSWPSIEASVTLLSSVAKVCTVTVTTVARGAGAASVAVASSDMGSKSSTLVTSSSDVVGSFGANAAKKARRPRRRPVWLPRRRHIGLPTNKPGWRLKGLGFG